MLAVIAVCLTAPACELGTEIDERMHRPEVVDRFLVGESTDGEPDQVIDSSPTTVVTEDGRIVFDASTPDGAGDLGDEPEDDIEPAEPTPVTAPPGVDLRVAGWWRLEHDLPDMTLDVRADIQLDLFEIDDETLVDMGLLTEADAGRFRLTKWYRVDGQVRFDLLNSGCTPQPNIDGCRLTRATDGSVEGLARVESGEAELALAWTGLGRGGTQLAVPVLEAEMTDSSGFRSSRTITAFADSLSSRVVGPPVALTVGANDAPFRAIGFDAEGELQVF